MIKKNSKTPGSRIGSKRKTKKNNNWYKFLLLKCIYLFSRENVYLFIYKELTILRVLLLTQHFHSKI